MPEKLTAQKVAPDPRDVGHPGHGPKGLSCTRFTDYHGRTQAALAGGSLLGIDSTTNFRCLPGRHSTFSQASITFPTHIPRFVLTAISRAPW